MQTQVKISWRQLFKNPLLVLNLNDLPRPGLLQRVWDEQLRRGDGEVLLLQLLPLQQGQQHQLLLLCHRSSIIMVRLVSACYLFLSLIIISHPGLNFPWKNVQFFFIRDTKCPNCFYFHTFVMFSISAGWWDLCCCKGGGVVGWWDDGSQLRLKLTIFKIFARKIYCWSLWWRRRIQG